MARDKQYKKFRALSGILILLLISLPTGCERAANRIDEIGKSFQTPQPDSTSESIHLLLGNPSGATADPANLNNYLIIGSTSAISYNNSRGTANWVSWLTALPDLGERLERPNFQPDSRLPDSFTRVFPSDYTRSGFDRGHLVPSADRFGNPEANAETFLMTNIVPQAGDLNQFPWERLETYSRSLVRRGFDVYTIAGVYGDQGNLRGKITVPSNCWKILVVLKSGSRISDMDENTRVIAVDMPNADGISRESWKQFQTSVRSIEDRTGNDFLSALPRELQDVLETRIDN